MAGRSWSGLWVIGLIGLSGWVQAAGNSPSPETRAVLPAEVVAVEDANVLKVRANGQTSRIQLAGVRRMEVDLTPEQCALVCQLGDTGCSQGLAAVPSHHAQQGRAYLEGLVAGQRVRVEFIEPGATPEPRLALVYRTSDNLFVNGALVRKGFAVVAEQPAFERLGDLRQAQTQAQTEKAGLWGAPLPTDPSPAKP
jgi:endonuclease YncB( thermonuclease family)